MRGGSFRMGGAIFHFSQKIGLKSTKNMRFCILHKPMGGARAPPAPPLGYATARVQTKGNNREEPSSKLKLSDKPQAKVALLQQQIKDFLQNSRFPSSCQLPADITIYSYFFFFYVKKRSRGLEEL